MTGTDDGNTGDGNTRDGNTGDGNTGDGNTGDGKGDGPGTGGDTGTGDPVPRSDVPGAPQRLSATPGDGHARLRWTAPDDDGGSPILRYQYQAAEGGGPFGGWIDIPDSAPNESNADALTITGLRNGERYTFRVRAVNGIGAGAASNSARVTPQGTAALDLSWLARFGRTVADHAIDAIDERVAPNALKPARSPSTGPAANLGPFARGTFAGTGTYGFGADNPDDLIATSPRAHDRAYTALQDLSTRKLLIGNSFLFSAFDDHAFADTQWTVWGRAAASRFAGSEGGRSLDGDVITGLIGADMEQGPVLAGVAVSHSVGEGTVDSATPRLGRTDVEASLTSVYPYARYAFSDRLSVWTTLGYGEGEYTEFGAVSSRPVEVDIGMKLGALGAGTRCIRRQRPVGTTWR